MGYGTRVGRPRAIKCHSGHAGSSSAGCHYIRPHLEVAHVARQLPLGLWLHGAPSEFLLSFRRNLVLPCDVLSRFPSAFLRIENAKTRRVFRIQHGKCTDRALIAFWEVVFARVAPDEPLWPMSPAAFRSRWDAVFRTLRLPCGHKHAGLIPRSLRGSGATLWYTHTEDVARIQWRGRWMRLRTLQHYLQEAAASLLLSDLPVADRARLDVLSQAAAPLLSAFLRTH